METASTTMVHERNELGPHLLFVEATFRHPEPCACITKNLANSQPSEVVQNGEMIL
jgi:hypothetical protein